MMKPLIFSTAAFEPLKQSVLAAGDFEEGRLERKFFPDGERYLRAESLPRGRLVVVLGGTITDEDTLELYDLASGLVHVGAARMTLVIPYFGYSTMERRVKDGEVVTAKTRARLLSSIPIAAMGNRVMLVDLHVDGLTYYFEGAVRPVHLYATDVVSSAIAELGQDGFVLGCTDAGRAKWVESLAHHIGVSVGFVYKRRTDEGATEVTGVSAHVAGQRVVIYDDMIRTGSSLLAAARAYLDYGATSVSAVCTHGVFPGDSLESIRKAGVIERIICTDSHPRALELEGDFLSTRSIGPLLAAELGREQ
ncbi:MAG: ribose-phosphate diphosphokinase [Deltaproteobacteria bacterium]|nr:ribose-phosphate diphosphokinase [Deltaproteobacteria bacterium]